VEVGRFGHLEGVGARGGAIERYAEAWARGRK
jgi:hypothetical protein